MRVSERVKFIIYIKRTFQHLPVEKPGGEQDEWPWDVFTKRKKIS